MTRESGYLFAAVLLFLGGILDGYSLDVSISAIPTAALIAVGTTLIYVGLMRRFWLKRGINRWV